MNIVEAMNARTPKRAYITRESWEYPRQQVSAAAVKILPTNSPNGCIICASDEKVPRGRWEPTAEDLTADDWVTTW